MENKTMEDLTEHGKHSADGALNLSENLKYVLLQNQYEGLKAQLNSVTDILKSKTEEIDQADAKKLELEIKVQSHEIWKNTCDEKLKLGMENLKQFKEEQNSLSEVIKKLEGEKNEILKKVVSTSTSYKKTVNTLSDRLKTASKMVETMTKEQDELKAINDENDKNNKFLEQKFLDLMNLNKEKIEAYEQEKTEHINQIRELRSKFEELYMQCQSKDNDINNLEMNYNNIKMTNDNLTNDIQIANEKLKLKHDEIEMLSAKISELRNQITVQNETLKREKATQISDVIQNANEKLKLKNDEIESLSAQINELKNEMTITNETLKREKSNQISELELDYRSEKNLQLKEIKRLNCHIKELETKLNAEHNLRLKQNRIMEERIKHHEYQTKMFYEEKTFTQSTVSTQNEARSIINIPPIHNSPKNPLSGNKNINDDSASDTSSFTDNESDTHSNLLLRINAAAEKLKRKPPSAGSSNEPKPKNRRSNSHSSDVSAYKSFAKKDESLRFNHFFYAYSKRVLVF